MKNSLKKGRDFIGQLIQRIKKRDLSGTGGTVIKNSGYKISATISAKVGSLVFTAVMARILMPELFGLYSLALSTIIFIAAFSDLGIDSAMVYFTSKFLKKGKKSEEHFKYLLRIKLILILITSLLLVLLAHFMANIYFQKPIFLAIIAGAIYLPFAALSQYIESSYLILGNFKIPFIKEIFFQIIRFVLIPLGVLYVLKRGIQGDLLITAIILLAAFCYFVSFVYLTAKAKKIMPFLKIGPASLSKKEKANIKRFTLPLTATVLSGIFFGYIDTLMLGRFVDIEFIGFYGAAFSIVSGLIAITGFLSIAVFPIFLQSKKKDLRRLLKKSLFASILIPAGLTILLFIFSDLIIVLVFGSNYLTASLYLKILSILLLTGTVSGMYNAYMVSQGKTKTMSKALIATTVLNIFLNYFFITYGLSISMNAAVIGACVATIISRTAYAGIVAYANRR